MLLVNKSESKGSKILMLAISVIVVIGAALNWFSHLDSAGEISIGNPMLAIYLDHAAAVTVSDHR